MAMANIFSFAVGDNAAAEGNFNFRMRFKKIGHNFERAGQILFVAVQIREDVASRSAVTAIDGVIHSAVLFDEGLHAAIVWQPVLCAVVRAGILHDMFQINALLVGNGRDAKLEPVGIAEAGRDD